jgi:hypothetical protein
MPVLNDIRCDTCGDEREVMTTTVGRGIDSKLLEKAPDGTMVDAMCHKCGKASMNVIFKKAPGIGRSSSSRDGRPNPSDCMETSAMATFSQNGEVRAIAPVTIHQHSDGSGFAVIDTSKAEAVPPREEMN